MPPGPTIDLLKSGGGNWRIVIAIGGYNYLLSDATSAQVLAAWADRPDWTQVLTGVTINHVHEHSLDPWNPFKGGGTLTIHVPPQSAGNTLAADPFGVEVHRKTAGDETLLNSVSMDRDATSATVASTTGFAASGTIHIGNEAIGYGSVTATTFDSLTRGEWEPFGADSSGVGYVAGRFAQDHNVVTDPNDIALFPKVREQRQNWKGRRVSVHLHRFDASTGTLNLRADALLIFAGFIEDVIDDPTTMCTVIQCTHILDGIRELSIGANIWSAKVEEGIELDVNLTPDFDCRDSGDDGNTYLTANPLQVVASGAATPNQINAGRYTTDELIVKINDWLAAEQVAGRLNGTHWVNLGSNATVGLRGWFNSFIPGAGPGVTVEFTIPKIVDTLLGGFTGVAKDNGRRIMLGGPSGNVGEDDVAYDIHSNSVPLRNVVDFSHGFDVYDENGTLIESTVGTILGNPNANVILSVDGAAFTGFYDSGSVTLIGPAPIGPPLPTNHPIGSGLAVLIPYDDPRPEIVVRQILAVNTTRAEAIKQIFYSTGTAGYNHATLDSLPAQLGLGIPGEILGDRFEQSVDQMPGANLPFTLVLDEPKKITEILTGSLIFSWSFLRWNTENECLEFCTWSTPTTGVTLSDANKAVAVGTDEHQLTSTIQTSEWAFPFIKVKFDRDILASGDDDGYRDSLTVVDRTAVDDASGQAKIKTIGLRDTYGRVVADALSSVFASGASLFTRSVSKVTRSIDSRFFYLSPGDCVLITDEFARDPDTGLRGVTTRPGLIIAIRWSLGGPGPNGSNADVFGEVDVMFKDVLRIGAYVPTAQVASYVIGTKVATITAHAHSEASEAVDASHFPVGAKIKWIERDPADPASPATHDDTIAGNSGNDLTMTTGFAAYDAGKVYRIVSDTYTDASATQQASFAYQADADALVQDARAPYEYVQSFLIGTFTTAATNDPVELPPNVSYGDGVGRDVGHEVAIARLANNLLDFKCPHSKPYLQQTEMSGAGRTTSSDWAMVDYGPINITPAVMVSSLNRSMTIAPYFKSSDGTSASCRVSLCRNRPTGDDIENVDRGLVFGSATFTTTSTTYATATAQTINLLGLANHRGDLYIVIELSEKARSYGLATVQVGARSN